MTEVMEWGFGDFVDIVVATQRRGWRVACNPKDMAEAVDRLEEVAEHERWNLADPPQLELHHDVPRHRIGFFDPLTGELTGLLSRVTNSEKGLARLKQIWLPGRST